jgi:hypothetical protein
MNRGPEVLDMQVCQSSREVPTEHSKSRETLLYRRASWEGVQGESLPRESSFRHGDATYGTKTANKVSRAQPASPGAPPEDVRGNHKVHALPALERLSRMLTFANASSYPRSAVLARHFLQAEACIPCLPEQLLGAPPRQQDALALDLAAMTLPATARQKRRSPCCSSLPSGAGPNRKLSPNRAFRHLWSPARLHPSCHSWPWHPESCAAVLALLQRRAPRAAASAGSSS